MTIEVSKVRSPDLYVKNESILFDRKQAELHFAPAPPLAAITFIAKKSDPSETLEDLAILCGREAFSLVQAVYDRTYKSWLFVSDGPWKDLTRIVLYQKLWKNYRDLVGGSADCEKSEEVAFKRGNKIRYAGLLEITRESIDKAINAARTIDSFAIIVSGRGEIDRGTSVGQIFSGAFSEREGVERESIDWMSLAIALCPHGDILLRVSGLFDDPEAAVDLIATPAVVKRLWHC